MAYVEGGFRSFIVGTTQIPAFSAVKISGGFIVVATAATDIVLGTTTQIGYANQPIDVRLRSAQGTANAVAGAAITENAALTVNGTGQLIPTSTAGNQIVGYAIAAVASGTLVEFQPSTAKY